MLSEAKPTLHEKYMGTPEKQAIKGLPEHLQSDLIPQLDTIDKRDRKLLDREARQNSWDDLDLESIEAERFKLNDQLDDFRKFLANTKESYVGHQVQERFNELSTAAAERQVSSEPSGPQSPADHADYRRLALRQRETTLRFMQMPQDEFDQALERWKTYEQIRFAQESQALEAAAARDDRRNYMIGPEKRKTQREMKELDTQNGGQFRRAAQVAGVVYDLDQNLNLDYSAVREKSIVTSFNEAWEARKKSPKFKKDLAEAKKQGRDETWLRKQTARKVFETQIEPEALKKANGNTDEAIKIIQTGWPLLEAVLATDESAEAFRTYTDKARKLAVYKGRCQKAMQVLLHTTAIPVTELDFYRTRQTQLRDLAAQDELDPSEQQTLQDLDLALRDYISGRHHATGKDKLARSPGVANAWSRTLGRFRTASRIGSGHTRTMRGGLYTGAFVASAVDLSGEMRISAKKGLNNFGDRFESGGDRAWNATRRGSRRVIQLGGRALVGLRQAATQPASPRAADSVAGKMGPRNFL